jgi:hypothetical protein
VAEHPIRTCTQCGQTDDHPRVVLANRDDEYHHDCLPFALRAELSASGGHFASIVEAAESGTHGDDLRAHIQQLHREG